jgi:hypothetical protein
VARRRRPRRAGSTGRSAAGRPKGRAWHCTTVSSSGSQRSSAPGRGRR